MHDEVINLLKKDINVIKTDIVGNYIYFKLLLSSGEYEFYMGIPDQFPRTLPNIISSNAIYPHFLTVKKSSRLFSGKPLIFEILKKDKISLLCYKNTKNLILYKASKENAIKFTLDQLKRLMTLSKKEIKEEFQKEFIYYFNQNITEKSYSIDLFIPPIQVVAEIDIIESKKIKIALLKNETLNKQYLKPIKIGKGMYIPLNNTNGILPPNCGVDWNKEFLLKLLSYHVNYDNYKRIVNTFIDTDKYFVVFKMAISKELEIMYTISLNFKTKIRKKLKEKLIDDLESISFISTKRCDMYYLQQRIGSNNDFYKKNVLLVGCGSLGSYIAQELPKIGIMKLSIIDSDILGVENIARHSLGYCSTGNNKANIMGMILERRFPQLEAQAYPNQFEEILVNRDFNLDEFDLIIISTGYTDRQLVFNEIFRKNNLKTSVLYTWIEGYGVGAHALLVDYNKPGCFNCLLSHKGKLINNKAHFLSEDNPEMLTGDGCGGTFNPYGNIILLQATSLIINVIMNYFNNVHENKNNLLFSMKNINSQNLNFNDRYNLSQQVLNNGIDDYIEKGYNVCGRKL